MAKRVVVTGVGLVTSTGIGKEEVWANVTQGRSGIGKISSFDASAFPCRIAGEAMDFDPNRFLSKRQVRKVDRFIQFGVAASKLALEDSNLAITHSNADKAGVIVSSSKGGIGSIEEQHRIYLSRGPRYVRFPLYLPSDLSGYISWTIGARGPLSNIATASTTGTQSIGEGFEIIRRGDASIMIVGASDASITPLSLTRFCRLRVLSTQNDRPERACKPFDARRDGMVIAEGAGVVVLESLQHAKARRAKILGEIVSYANAGESYHAFALNPSGAGAEKVMRSCLGKARISPEEIDYISAHGTATKQNDKYETVAIKKVFGEHAYKVDISSVKSTTGHMLAAGGALGFVVAVLAVERGVIPPTINYSVPDEDCDLNYVPNRSKKRNLRYALSNAFGFGGYCAALLVRKYVHE